MDALLREAADRAVRYLEALDERRVSPSPSALEGLSRFSRPLQDQPLPAGEVLEELDSIGSPAAVASAGGRYFGFVIGGSLPAALAVNILAAARHALRQAQGLNVEARGLFGAPPITVIVGDEVHVSLLKALSLLGLGRERVVRVAVDGKGRMIAEHIAQIGGPTVVCLQAGNVNTGAFDPRRGNRFQAPRDRRMDPYRRGLRPVGGSFPVKASPGSWSRESRLPGDGCSQVAQRPVRQRPGHCSG